MLHKSQRELRTCASYLIKINEQFKFFYYDETYETPTNIEDFMDEYENKYEELCNNIHRALNRKFSVFRVAISIMNSSKHPVSLVQ